MKITRIIDNETNTQKVWVQDEPGAPWREFDPADELIPLRAEVERLKRENGALRVQLEDMTNQFFAVSQENAALRDDKKLVDWLAENEASAVFEPGDPEVGLFPAWSVYYNDREPPVVHADLRAAINAARAKKGGAS
jgi:hypothetical protein